MADDAVLLRAERLDRPLRREIEVIGAQADHFASELFEAVQYKKFFLALYVLIGETDKVQAIVRWQNRQKNENAMVSFVGLFWQCKKPLSVKRK